jgi:ferritin-like protein
MATSALTRRAAIVGGAVALGGAMAGSASRAGAAVSPTDIRILNFVLRLEELEAGFYSAALDRGALRGEVREFADTVFSHERQHVEFLRGVLGANAIKKPKLRFGAAVTNERRFVAAATTLEDTVVSAYNGQAANLGPTALGAAARIVSVEARHAAWIRAIAGKRPAVDATDPIRTDREVQAAIDKLGFLR